MPFLQIIIKLLSLFKIIEVVLKLIVKIFKGIKSMTDTTSKSGLVPTDTKEISLAYIWSFIGKWYKWGGDDPKGFDCCLVGDSLVETDTGLKEIKDFKGGEMVLSVINGETCFSRVSNVFNNGVKTVYRVKTTGNSIDCTSNHKFLVVKKDLTGISLTWVETKDLKINDVVLCYFDNILSAHPYNSFFKLSKNLSFFNVVGLELSGQQETYDLEVENSRCYIANNFVVHNSGLALEYLKSFGLVDRKSDFSAAQMWEMYKSKRVEKPSRGCLVFWGDSNGKVIHVEVMLNDELSLGASGGGSKTITEEDAMRDNAFIKVRKAISRNGIVGYVDPFKN